MADVVKEYESAVKEKQAIEAEIEAFAAELTSGENPPGLRGPLVDADGFPRADVDVYRVRHLRHSLACRQTDHKRVMDRIERLLPQVFASKQSGTLAHDGAEAKRQQPITRQEQELPAFALVQSVDCDSPAQAAGLQPQDQVLKFGSADASNHRHMAAVKDIVQRNVGNAIRVLVRRNQQQLLALELTPQSWRGPGVLGCLLQPLQR